MSDEAPQGGGFPVASAAGWITGRNSPHDTGR